MFILIVLDIIMEPALVCRVCFEDENDLNKLITPCKCKGSSKYIHHECLKIWVTRQIQEKLEGRCEVCKYLFNVEVKTVRKCDLRDSLNNRPHVFCYLFTFALILAVLAIILFVVIQKKYVEPEGNVGYFVGILAIFLIAGCCSIAILIKIVKSICFVRFYEEYSVFPYKEDEGDLNTTHILNSIYRIESCPLEAPAFRVQEMEERLRR
jgi:hypothetical protein